jgi:hypothetical protein
MGYDIIGDIHGHADRLEGLLAKLGYAHRAGAWRHLSRTAIFVGDFIDRGPGQLRTLEIVRAMLDAGAARAVMGNHELNAIAWVTPDPDDADRYLRPRHGDKGEKNRRQHEAFLAEVGSDTCAHKAWADWFMELPLWIEEPSFRVVHACWSPTHADALRPHLRPEARLTPALLENAHRKGTPEFRAVDVLLKGPEVALPEGRSFTDKDGHVRGEIRTRWWDRSAWTYAEAYIGPPGVDIPDVPLAAQLMVPEPDRPVFVGHYGLEPPFAPLSAKVCCVDFSVAKGGPLVSYRYDGEQILSAEKFVCL